MTPAHLTACLLLCERYGIRIDPRPGLHAQFSEAPGGFVCNLEANTIEVPAEFDWREHVDLHAPLYGPEAFLHEAMHLVMQPPFRSIDRVPEEWILMQVEWSVARAMLDKAGRDLVKAWQLFTITGGTIHNKMYGDKSPHWREGYWRRGFAMARKLGVLTCHNEPTWRWPQWDRLSEIEVASCAAQYEADLL